MRYKQHARACLATNTSARCTHKTKVSRSKQRQARACCCTALYCALNHPNPLFHVDTTRMQHQIQHSHAHGSTPLCCANVKLTVQLRVCCCGCAKRDREPDSQISGSIHAAANKTDGDRHTRLMHSICDNIRTRHAPEGTGRHCHKPTTIVP
jgi:hypothetical protein